MLRIARQDHNDTIPAFVKVLLCPEDPQIWEQYARKAKREIFGNQKLLNVLLEKIQCSKELMRRIEKA